jgi:regulatory protein
VEQKLKTMKMDSEEIDEIIAHLIGSILNEERCLQFCQRKTPHQAMGKDQNNKRAKIQKINAR